MKNSPNRMHATTLSKRTQRCVLLTLCCLAFVYPASMLGQERKDGFFDKDFVKGAIKGAGESELKSPKDISKDSAFQVGRGKGEADSKSKSHSKSEPQQSSPFKNEAKQPPKDAKSPVADTKVVTARGTKVYAVTAVVNGMDADHYSHCIDELAELAEETNTPIRQIYQVGYPTKPLKTISIRLGKQESKVPIDTKLLMRGVQIIPVHSIPARYNIARSPVWILSTDEGQILLEAPKRRLRQYFNKHSEFVEGVSTGPIGGSSEATQVEVGSTF